MSIELRIIKNIKLQMLNHGTCDDHEPSFVGADGQQ